MRFWKNNNKTLINSILFTLGLLIFSYTSIRAYLLSFTWDESYSYLKFVRNNFIFFSEYDRLSANNHLLNTWLMEFCSNIFGTNEFVLRLPNLFGHFIFLIYSAKLSKKLSSNILIIGSFILFNINPFLLDFFSLARGYGLSMGLMMGSIYFAYKFIRNENYLYSAIYSILFATTSSLANLTILNYLLIITILYFFTNIFRNRENVLVEKNKISIKLIYESTLILLPLSTLFFFVPLINNLRKAHALFFGGTTGFWNDTVFSLINATVYDNTLMHKTRNGVQIGIAIILLSSVRIIYKNIKEDKIKLENLFFIFIILTILMCFLFNYFQYIFIGIPFLKERTALFYFPLFITLIIFLFDYLLIGQKQIFNFLFIGITLFFILNFILNANIRYVIQWKEEADTKEMIQYLIKRKQEIYVEKDCITICLPMQFVIDVDFYKTIYRLKWLNPNFNEESCVPTTDYFFMNENSPYLSNISYKIVKNYPASNMILFENENNFDRSKSKIIPK